MDRRTMYRVLSACFLLLAWQLCSGDPVLKDEMGSACLYFHEEDAILPCDFYEQTKVHSGNMESSVIESGAPITWVGQFTVDRNFQRDDAFLPRRELKVHFWDRDAPITWVGEYTVDRYFQRDDAFLPHRELKVHFWDRGVPAEKVEIRSAYRYIKLDDAFLPGRLYGKPKVHLRYRGVRVEKVEMGSAYRYFQRDDAILPRRFYGQLNFVFWDMVNWTIFLLVIGIWKLYKKKVRLCDGLKKCRRKQENKNWIVHFLLLLSCVLRYNVAGGQVITDPNVVLIKGSEASLQCSFHGTPLQLFWLKNGGPSMSEVEPLIGWSNGRTLRSGDDSGKFNLSENFSLIFTADIRDAGRFYCDVSNDIGIKIGGYTDVTVAVPPSDLFPTIDNFMNPDGNQRTTITCRADGASIGLVDLQWMHNGDLYPQINRNFTNADGTTENLTSTIQAHVSEEPYICVGTLKATKRVNSTDEVLVQRTLISTIPSKKPTEQLTTPIEVTDNNDTTVILAAVSCAILLAIAVFCVKMKKLPTPLLRLCKTCQKEGRQQDGPNATLQQGVINVGSQGEASVILMTLGKR